MAKIKITAEYDIDDPEEFIEEDFFNELMGLGLEEIEIKDAD